MMKKALLLIFILMEFCASAQSRLITGTVNDISDGNSLPGVNISFKEGKNTATVTDKAGNFSLTIPNEGVLVFSFIGYKTQEFATKGLAVLSVSMSEDTRNLNEVVVTGYAPQTKRESSGSVATIKAKSIRQIPLASFDQMLQGQAPGLLVIGGSGQPGSAATVRLRGIGSINGSNAPLYILDGVQISAANFASLNADDFETINVLKDASATAIYGSRGANGVIVITSKRGKSGEMKIEYSALRGTTDYPTNPIEVMNTNEKIDYELARGGTPISKLSKEDLGKLRQVNTDWESLIFQKGVTNQHQISLSGGTEKLTYYVSGNLFNQEGTVKGTNLDRYTGRINLDGKEGSFSFGVSASMGFSKYNYVAESDRNLSSPLNGLRWANPYETAYNQDSTYTILGSGLPNPIREINERQRLISELKGIGSIYLQYQIPFVKGLALKTNWGTDYQNWDITNYFSKLSSGGIAAQGKQGILSRDNDIQNRITGTNSLTYSKTFGKHYLNAGLYHELVKQNNSSFGFTGYGLTGRLQNEAGITPGSPTNDFIPQVSGGASRRALLSYFSNLTYGFNEKYYLNLNVRRDGSSRFGTNNRYANFASVGANWIISSENFMQNVSFINYLKLKASYGTVGNQEGIGSFAARELFGTANYNGKQGNTVSQLSNPELRWEQKNKTNIGLEYELFKSRITGSVELYNDITTNLFLNYQLSRTTGFSSLNRNIGEMQNKGIEIALNTVNIRKGKFEWTTNLSFTYNQNLVKKLSPDTPKDGIATDFGVIREGLPVGAYFLMESAGVNPKNGNAQYKNLDGTLTESYNPTQKKVFSNALAPYFGGFTNTLRFAGIEASAFFTYSFGNYIYNFALADLVDPNYYADNVAKDLINEWKKEGDQTEIPRASQPMERNVTRFLEKGDFLRLRNLTISYTLPNAMLEKVKVKSVRVFVQGQNIKTFTKFRGYDPELAGTLVGAQYPALLQLTGGLNITF
jgi:TonB-dependent starch-binding outer membrane protein SusC